MKSVISITFQGPSAAAQSLLMNSDSKQQLFGAMLWPPLSSLCRVSE